MLTKKNFGDDFIWGTAISAYQTEGAWNEDGKGESIWDRFCTKPGAIHDGEDARIACNSYHMWQEDIGLLSRMSVPNFRFSLSWPRIMPEGIGRLNSRGVDFYNCYIDLLLEKNITPWLTLYHWDLPQKLQDKGGWTNPEIVDWFSEYCAKAEQLFGDRIRNWVAFNEPSIASFFGYGTGIHAPGKTGEENYLKAAHQINRSINRGVCVIKAAGRNHNVGSSYTTPLIKSNAGETDPAIEIFDAIWNRNYLSPVMTGCYPEIFQDKFAAANAPWDKSELKTPLDFIGFQYYSPIFTKKANAPEKNFFGAWFDDTPDTYEKTSLGWGISPESFGIFINDFVNRYGKETPIIVTENGCAWKDQADPGKDEHINDQNRIDYVEKHLTMLHENFPDMVKGYFYWSFLDNFEWADGYAPRFGLVHVDYRNDCKRTPKASFFWFRDFLQND